MNEAGEPGEGAEQHGIRQRPSDVLERELGGGDSQRMPGRKLLSDSGKLQVVETARAVDQQIAVRLKALEHVHDLKQGRVLHDYRVRLEDRLAQADFLVVDAAVGDDRRAHALRAEARKG